MRKYQQLALLVISCISVGILLMYKTENSRLKDVLHVVNFFSRNDAAIMKRIDNNSSMQYNLDFLYPMAVWQSIGDNFHAYSSHWRRNELVAGGEAVALVVGRRGAVLNFKCSLNFKGASVQGKFRFQRIDKDAEDDKSEFTRYNFYCKVTRDFGVPESVVFNELGSSTKDGHSIKLRMIKTVDKEFKKLAVQPLTICVNLFSNEFFNMTPVERRSQEMLEFFIHHFVLGVEDFIVYSGDELPPTLMPILNSLKIRVHAMPFNFPYSAINSSERIRSIIEMDCLLRNINRARYVLLLQPNEFFYPNAKLDSDICFLRELKPTDNAITHYDMQTFATCKDQKHKYLVDNTLYDPELQSLHPLSVYRLQDNGITLSADDLFSVPHRRTLEQSKAFAHRYVNCLHVGKDGLHDWRNSLREEFMKHIQRLREEIQMLI